MYKINCRVCNTLFDSRMPQYKQCSKECAKKYVGIYNKNYQETHKEQISEGVNRRHKINPKQRKKFARVSYLNTHGVNEEWYSIKMSEQEEACALCGAGPNGKNGFHIDHDHSLCGHIPRKSCIKCNRGLLCNKCNTTIGHLEIFLKQMGLVPTPIYGTWLEKAVKYIQHHKTLHGL
jgi:Recombination endonuclease VII